MTMQFGLLGAVEAHADGQAVELGHARQRSVLAALLVDADRVVPMGQLVDRVWGEHAPVSVQATLYGYLSRLRQALAPGGAAARVERRPGGYIAAVDPASVDLHRFRRLAAQARAADDPSRAQDLLTEALSLWRGDPFSTLDTPWFGMQRETLIRERQAAELDLCDLRLRCGRHAEVLAEVTARVDADPLNERAAGQLMLALYKNGRTADALLCYERTRALLASELGVDPSPSLTKRHAQILNGGADLSEPARLSDQEETKPVRAWSAPGLLPPTVADFTGRAEETALLTGLLTADSSRAMPVVAVVGMGGVGKTALALHVAHSVAGSYPDGQLWIDLRGADASALKAGDALARFLRALGVPDRTIPAGPAERAEMYRTLLRGRQVLVVLDNAGSEEQIRPLLPGAGTCAVVITSRVRLAGIEGLRRTDMDVFPAREAIDLLARIAGEDRVGAQHESALRIAELCAGLPLAVRIAGARLGARPAWRLDHLASMLDDEHRRLDQLAAGDLAVRASLMLSYRGLDDAPRRLFRLLGLFDAPGFPPWLAEVVLECPPHEAAGHAEALVDAQLLIVSGVDPAGQYRYRFHDLVRLFAAERAMAEETAGSRAGALARGLGGWLSLAERMAVKIAGPCYASISGPAPRPPTGHVLAEFADEWATASWFDAERTALLAGVRQACRLGLDDLAFDLAGCLEKYFDLRGMYTDWISLNTRVMAVCQERGNLLGEAVMLRGLLDVTTWITDGRDGDAMARLHTEAFRLREMFTEAGHKHGTLDAAVMCSWSLTANGAYPDAIKTATEALALARESGHLGGEIRADLALAVAHFESRDVEVALRHAGSALAKSRALGNPRCVATALQFAGIGHRQLGQLGRSRQMLDESLAISREYRDTYTEVLTLLTLARVQLQTGDPGARATAEAALALSREHNMSHHLAQALEIFGCMELTAGRPGQAIACLEESVALWRTRGWHSFLATALTSLGKACSDVDPAAARRAFTEAHELFDRLGDTANAVLAESLARG